MIKVKKVKFGNSILCKEEKTFWTDNEAELFRDGVVIYVKHKRSGEETCTSLFNTVYWVEDKTSEQTQPEAVRRTGRPPKQPQA